jgi:hypothetical protein
VICKITYDFDVDNGIGRGGDNLRGAEFLEKVKSVCFGKKEKELLSGVRINDSFMLKGSDIYFLTSIKDIKVFSVELHYSFLSKKCDQVSISVAEGLDDLMSFCKQKILQELYAEAGEIEGELYFLKKQKEIFLNKIGVVRECIKIVTEWE